MIYEVKKDEKTYKIDDLVFLSDQPSEVQAAINSLKNDDMAEFDNATVLLFDTGRILVNEKTEER